MQLRLLVHDIRSCHNVGSLLRTAEGFGVEHIYFTGYTPYPVGQPGDDRLPHIAAKLQSQIHKTALGAETMVPWSHQPDIGGLIKSLQSDGFDIVALEQTQTATALPDAKASPKLALLIGREVEGIEPALLSLANRHVEIPMVGRKESFNVVQATAIALYHFACIAK